MNIAELLQHRVDIYSGLTYDEMLLHRIEVAVDTIVAGLDGGGKVIVAGNGGSAALADHFVAELVGRYKSNRKSLPAVSLSSNSINTAIANDFEFRQLFSYQLEGMFQSASDTLVLFTTSGQSKNILHALETAKKLNLLTVVICGKNTDMLGDADVVVPVNCTDTALIQEVHQSIVHIICEGIDNHYGSR